MPYDPRRHKTLYTALYRENESERSNAASALYRFWIECGLHPDDVTLSVGSDLIARNRIVIQRLEQDLATITQENQYLRRHVPADTLRQAGRAREIAYLWFDLEDLALAKFATETGELPRYWRSLVCKHVGATTYQMQRWERGLVPIPEQVFDALRNLPSSPRLKEVPRLAPDQLAAKVAALEAELARIHPTKKPGKRLTSETRLATAALLFEGWTDEQIANKLRVNDAKKTIEYTPPPQCVIIVPSEGPLDWYQMWEIQSRIKSPRAWRTEGLLRLRLPEHLAYTQNLAALAPPAIVQEMREEYFDKDTYQRFKRMALRDYPKGAALIGWNQIESFLRLEYGVAPNHNVGGLFAARFNAEEYPLFDIKETTANRWQEVMELRAKLNQRD